MNKSKKITAAFTALMLCLTSLTGCGGTSDSSLEKKLVGKWELDDIEVEFKKDKTFEAAPEFDYEDTIEGTYSVKNGDVVLNVDGEKITWNDLEFDGSSFTVTDEDDGKKGTAHKIK